MAKKPPTASAASSPPPPPPPVKFASIHPGVPPHPGLAPSYQLPSKLVDAVTRLEAEVRLPIWLLIQDARQSDREAGKDTFNLLGDTVATAFFAARHTELKKGQRIGLVIDSPGGLAKPTYELAMLLRRHCGGYVAIVPRHAKSAATLLSLGADEIVLNVHAELGPLDVQIYDPDREEKMSGLDEVQALERLQAFALRALDHAMLMYRQRTGKKAKTLFPVVSDFVTKLTQPMFAGIDVVRYTQLSRALKIGEEYGKRLLAKSYGERVAADIAFKLVTDYPEHGFPIYSEDLLALGLNVAALSVDMQAILEEMSQTLDGLNFIGRMT